MQQLYNVQKVVGREQDQTLDQRIQDLTAALSQVTPCPQWPAIYSGSVELSLSLL